MWATLFLSAAAVTGYASYRAGHGWLRFAGSLLFTFVGGLLAFSALGWAVFGVALYWPTFRARRAVRRELAELLRREAPPSDYDALFARLDVDHKVWGWRTPSGVGWLKRTLDRSGDGLWERYLDFLDRHPEDRYWGMRWFARKPEEW